MSQKARDYLKNRFSDGQRPSGGDFSDLIDSFLNPQGDPLSFDTNGDVVLTHGVRLGDSTGNTPGGLRFNGNQLQIFTNGQWTNVASGGGAGQFQSAPSTPGQPPVVRDSFVGIGNFPNPPQFKLDVQLDAAAGQVRFGNVACGNGAGLTFQTAAVIAHQTQAAANVNNNFALRQASTGELHLNAPTGQPISLRQGGSQVRLGISATGNVIVSAQSELASAPANATLQVSGEAFKSLGTSAWLIPSDARLKEDVRDLEAGLAAVRQVRPVRFRYNGLAGTSPGRAGVGVLAQEIEAVLPETVQRGATSADPALSDLRVFDASMLTYVLINAVKELAAKVERLEEALAAAAVPAVDAGPVTA